MEVWHNHRCSNGRRASVIRIRRNASKIIQDGRYLLGIALGILSCEIALRISCNYRSPAISMFAFLHSRAYIFLSMLLCMLPAAFEYYEDIKEGNVRNVLSRIPLEDYIHVKTWSASMTTWLSYMIIKIAFFGSYGMVYGFADTVESEILLDLWIPIYNQGHFILYLIMATAFSGLLPVLIVNVVLCVSVWIPNMSVIFSTPIILFYLGGVLLETVFENQEWTNYASLFCGSWVLFGSRVLHVAFTTLFVLLGCIVAKFMTRWAWRRRIYG